MSTGYKIIEGTNAYYLTFQVVGWVDVFSRKVYRDIIIESLGFCQEHKGLEVFAYVVMSNHIHLFARSSKGDLSGIIRDFKKYTSRRILETIDEQGESRRDWMRMVFKHHGCLKEGQTFQVWTHENHAEHVYSQKFIEQKVTYIHENPVRAGIVANAADYLYSSARNYAGLSSLLEITKVDLAWKTF